MHEEKIVKLLNEVRDKLEKIEELLREILYDFRGMRIAFEITFGRWGILVGRTMEIVFTQIFKTISQKGGIKINTLEIPPLRDIKKLEKKGEFEFEISGIDPEGAQWLIDVKYRFVFKRDAKRAINAVRRWLKTSNNKQFVFCLIVLIGLEEGVREYLEKEIKKLGGKAIIIDPPTARKLIELFAEQKVPIYESRIQYRES